MNSDSNKLLPAHRRFYKTPVKGKRTVISIALDQPKISAKSNVSSIGKGGSGTGGAGGALSTAHDVINS